jgi:hypothetical protein
VPIILFALLVFVLLAMGVLFCFPLLCAIAPALLDGKAEAGLPT